MDAWSLVLRVQPEIARVDSVANRSAKVETYNVRIVKLLTGSRYPEWNSYSLQDFAWIVGKIDIVFPELCG